MTWEGLNPQYGTIVADPPWRYPSVSSRFNVRYSTMTVDEIAAMPVADLAPSYLWLWVTAASIEDGYRIVRAWGCEPIGLLTWCKTGKPGVGRILRHNTEHAILAGPPGCPSLAAPILSAYHLWPRAAHSVKPPAFYDLLERHCPGPYVELFARAPRLGWDHWGHGYEIGAAS